MLTCLSHIWSHGGGLVADHGRLITRRLSTAVRPHRPQEAGLRVPASDEEKPDLGTDADRADLVHDAHGHVWMPYKRHFDWYVETSCRSRCLRVTMAGGQVKYKKGNFSLLKDSPPSPCVKHRKSECPF